MITVDDLTLAIEKSIDNGMRLDHQEALDLAQHLLNFFGYSRRIIDNVLEPDDRDTFYMLEENGILKTQREEVTLYDGREWRIHYWLFWYENIAKLINKPEIADTESEVIETVEDVYKNLPREAWERSEEDEE